MTRLCTCLPSLLSLLVLACSGSTTSTPADLTASSMNDLAPPRDLATPDLAPPEDLAIPDDLSPPVDLRRVDLTPAGECQLDGDCRLFASYCSTAPCTCIPLPKGLPDPTCVGMMVNCFGDPCLGKVAACVNNHCLAR